MNELYYIENVNLYIYIGMPIVAIDTRNCDISMGDGVLRGGTNGLSITGSVNIDGSSIELGTPNTTGIAYIDFRTYNSDSDARIMVSGGSSTGLYTGNVNLTAGSVTLNAASIKLYDSNALVQPYLFKYGSISITIDGTGTGTATLATWPSIVSGFTYPLVVVCNGNPTAHPNIICSGQISNNYLTAYVRYTGGAGGGSARFNYMVYLFK